MGLLLLLCNYQVAKLKSMMNVSLGPSRFEKSERWPAIRSSFIITSVLVSQSP